MTATDAPAAPGSVTSAPPGDRRPRLAYAPALDGLRALAVGAVLLYHGSVPSAGGGFLGVDLFFVLSGYLITTLLLQEHEGTGRIDVRAFWARRARRLLPALLAVLVATAVAWIVIATPSELRGFRGDGLSALGYLANWRFIIDKQSYFEALGLPSPVRHMWSLGIEEQWYLLWPAVLLLALRLTGYRRDRVLALTLAAGTASAAVMAVLASGRIDLSRPYYGTDARAQSLLAGAVLAMVLPRLEGRGLGRWRNLVGVLALLGFIALVVGVDDADRWLYYGGFLIVAPTCAALVAAATGPAEGPFRAALAAPILVGIGRISYGLYLWHWPVFVVMTPDRVALSGAPLFVARVAITGGLSVASYFLLEMPVRRHTFGPWRAPALAFVSIVAVAALLLAAPGLGVKHDELLATGFTEEQIRDAREAAAHQPPPDLSVLVLGDSVAWNLFWGIRPGDLRRPIKLDQRARIGCGVVTGGVYQNGQNEPSACALSTDDWAGGAALDPDVTFVLTGSWEVFDHVVDGRVLRVGTPEYARHLTADLERHLRVLTEGSDTKVLLATVPCYDQVDLELGGTRLSDRNDERRVAAVNRVYADVAERMGDRVDLVDVGGFLCPDGHPLRTIDGADVRHTDGVHLRRAGIHALWRWLEPQLRRAAGVQS